ncbi:SPFH domain-containing protein (plasmid) [Rossellomorea sp. AcN35-11]|nr:flotillin family protein [Rossellomorea aquimaris]WJV32154.1 SPFH domain-containing protein [Rossellomorea sp. AcN35-11]
MKLLGFLVVLIPVLVLGAIGGIVWWFYMKVRFKTATSNQALIITGTKLFNLKNVDDNGVPLDKSIYVDENGRSMKIIRGGGHRLKMFQTATKVDLKSFNLTVQSSKAYSRDAIPLQVLATAVVSVGEDKKTIARYAEKYLGKSEKDVKTELTDVLEGHLRSIMATLDASDAYQNYEKVNEGVRKIAIPALQELGFDLTFTLKEIKDSADKNSSGLGFIEALGQPQIEKVRKDAEISKSENEKEARIKKAEDERQTSEAVMNNEREVARIKKEKDLEDAAIKEETERARAKSEQSYNLEKAKLDKQVQEETLKLEAARKEEELRIKHFERERAVKLEEEEAKVRKAKADADYYDTTKKAEAEARKAQIDGDAKAEIRRKEGLAEAEVIERKGKAEAESKRLLAEAIAKHGEVVIVEKLIEMLPMYAEAMAKPLSNIDSVKIIDSGNGNGVASYGKSITGSMALVQESIKEATGIDVGNLLRDYVNRGNTHTVIREETKDSVVYSNSEENEEHSDEEVVESETTVEDN